MKIKLSDNIKVVIVTMLVGLAFVLLMSGCKPCECLTSVEYRDSIVVRSQRDTIQYYNHDSIYVHERGDTVWRERWSIRYRDRIVERVDTCYKTNTQEVVRVEKYVPQYYKGVSWAFWILFVCIVLYVVARILVRVYLHK